jgi:hypothetical protein
MCSQWFRPFIEDIKSMHIFIIEIDNTPRPPKAPEYCPAPVFRKELPYSSLFPSPVPLPYVGQEIRGIADSGIRPFMYPGGWKKPYPRI